MKTSTCRLCMKEGKRKFVSVFFDTDDGKLSEKIMFCTSLKIKEEDKLPHSVCGACVEKLQIAYDFRKQCETSEKILIARTEGLIEVKSELTDDIDIIENELQVSKTRPANKKKTSLGEIIGSKGDDMIIDLGKRKRKVTVVKSPNKLPDLTSDADDEVHGLDDNDNDNDNGDHDYEPCDESKEVKMEMDDFLDDLVPAPDQIDSSKENKKKKGRKKKDLSESLDDGLPKKRGRKPKIYYDEDGKKLEKKPPASYFCEHCGKMFRCRSYLNLHVHLHTADKTFECGQCGKKFTTKQYLTRHTRSHSDEKLYKCEYCDRAFNDWGSRQKHERLHRNEKPYTCEICGKQFAYSYSLKSHKLVHTGVKLFGCEICKKNFTMKYHLMNHARRRHADLLASGVLLMGTMKLEPTLKRENVNGTMMGCSEEEIAALNLQIDLNTATS